MVDVTMPPPPTATPVPIPPAAAPAPAAAKKLTPAEILAEMTRNADVIRAVEPNNPNAQQVTDDMQAILRDNFQGREQLVVDYQEAMQKLMEARLKAGLDAAPPDPNDRAAAEADRKKIAELPRRQRNAVEAAEGAADDARKAAEAQMGPAPKKGEPDPLAADKDALRRMITAYGKPKADEAHQAMLRKTTDELIKRSPAPIRLGNSMYDYIKAVDKAAKDTTDAGKVALEQAKKDLKAAVDKDRLTRDLNDRDRQAIVDAIAANAAAALQVNEKENPVATMAEKTKEAAVEEARNLPRTVLQTAMQTSGASTMLNNPLVNVARRIIPGGSGPGTPS